MIRPPLRPTLFPYTTLFRSNMCYKCDARLDCTVAMSLAALLWFYNLFQSICRCLIGYRPASRRRPKYRSEEHTSELQSLTNLVCRLLLEKKKQNLRVMMR